MIKETKKAPGHVLEQLANKDWGELNVAEFADYLLFPAEIYRLKKDGSFEATPVMMRVPRPKELREARVEARAIAKRDKLDLKEDQDLMEDIETVCLLAKCIRNTSDPYEPLVGNPEELERLYDRKSLAQAWETLDALSDITNPQPDSIGEDEMALLIAAIAKERTILPLAVFGPGVQTSCIVTMATQLTTLKESESYSELSEPSM